MTTIILGGGIVGCSTAFELSLIASPSQIHLVEPSPNLFASASGNAGGFLAKDWFSVDVLPLGELSFVMHAELAKKYGGRERWGWSGSNGLSFKQGSASESGHDWLGEGTSRALAASGTRDRKDSTIPNWLDVRKGAQTGPISDETSTAQVDPLRLSRFLLDESLARGVHFHHPAQAISVSHDANGMLESVRICNASGTETDIPCARLVITAGAWTPTVFRTLFPRSPLEVPINPLAGHSLVVRSPRWASDSTGYCHAVFCSADNGFAPEIFSRVGGEIYVAGLNTDALPLPALPSPHNVDNASVQRLRSSAESLLGSELEVVCAAVCFRPVTPRGVPIISRVTDDQLGMGAPVGGVFICAGHGPWGISLSLGTGRVLAEMVEGRATSVDVSALGL